MMLDKQKLSGQFLGSDFSFRLLRLSWLARQPTAADHYDNINNHHIIYYAFCDLHVAEFYVVTLWSALTAFVSGQHDYYTVFSS